MGTRLSYIAADPRGKYLYTMATFGRPDGYDDSSEDEFDGFVFGDSYNSREEFGHKDRDFVPSASGMVKRDKEACSDHTSPEPSGKLVECLELVEGRL